MLLITTIHRIKIPIPTIGSLRISPGYLGRSIIGLFLLENGQTVLKNVSAILGAEGLFKHIVSNLIRQKLPSVITIKRNVSILFLRHFYLFWIYDHWFLGTQNKAAIIRICVCNGVIWFYVGFVPAFAGGRNSDGSARATFLRFLASQLLHAHLGPRHMLFKLFFIFNIQNFNQIWKLFFPQIDNFKLRFYILGVIFLRNHVDPSWYYRQQLTRSRPLHGFLRPIKPQSMLIFIRFNNSVKAVTPQLLRFLSIEI